MPSIVSGSNQSGSGWKSGSTSTPGISGLAAAWERLARAARNDSPKNLGAAVGQQCRCRLEMRAGGDYVIDENQPLAP
jgi:hypothetical protein